MAGALVSLNAVPAQGWQVSHWNGADSLGSGSGSNALAMKPWIHTVSVNYILTCYALTLDHTGSGSDPSADPASSSGCGTGHHTVGEHRNLTASPANDWHVSKWQGSADDSSTGSINSWTMLGADHTISVTYEENLPTTVPTEDVTPLNPQPEIFSTYQVPVESDAHVASAQSTTNYGQAEALVVQWLPQPDGSTLAFLRFDISGLLPDTRIVQARLSLAPSGQQNDSQATVQVHEASETWQEETVNWANRPDYSQKP